MVLQSGGSAIFRDAEKSDEDVLIMKNNMNTTLELPEGTKATIQGKVIDGKNYLVVEVENEEQELKEGDYAIFWDYTSCEAIIAVIGGF